MTMTERPVGSITVLELSGRLTSGDTGQLKDQVSHLLSSGHPNVVLDLANLTYMDSSGLGQMVSCHVTAQGKGAVKLANVGTRIQDLLVITKLNVVFDVYPSVNEAVASFVPTA
jgi:anti-sigma B factor antagonist